MKENSQSWDEMWSDNITEAVSDRNGHVVASLPIASRSDALKGLQPRLWSLERRMRSLIRMINLTYMVEERSFADYRLGIEQRIDSVRSDTDDLKRRLELVEAKLRELQSAAEACLKGADNAFNRLNKQDPEYENTVSDLTKLKAQVDDFCNGTTELVDIVLEARNRVAALNYVVSQPAFKGVVADVLSVHWEDVNKAFGTWLRRIHPALKSFGFLVIVSLLTYLLVGSLIPSFAWTWLLGAVAIGTAIWRYYQTRGRLERRISKLAEGFGYIDPDSTERNTGAPRHRRGGSEHDGGGSSTFWNVSALAGPALMERLSAVLRDSHYDAMLLPNPTTPTKILLAGLVGGMTLAIVAWTLAFPSPAFWPRYSVTLTDPATSGCALAFGKILWAGPGDLILRDTTASEGRLTLIPLRSGLRMQQALKAPPPCIPVVGNGPPLTLISVLNPGVQIRRSAVIPFFPGPVHGCGSLYGQGTSLTADGRTFLSRLKDILKSCSKDRPARIDVRGFASTKEFACTTADQARQLNWDLAEKRREVVLTALGAKRSSDGKRWFDTPFALDPDSANRWSSEEEMRSGKLFNDSDQSIARYVEIRVKDGGDCVASD